MKIVFFLLIIFINTNTVFAETADTSINIDHCIVGYGNSIFWINDLNLSYLLGSISFIKQKLYGFYIYFNFI